MRFELREEGWETELCKHFLDLSRQSRRERFFYSVSEEQVLKHCETANPEFVLFAKSGDQTIGVADVYQDGEDLEIGISVRDDFQRKGYGGKLFSKALSYAKKRGFKRMNVVYAAGNSAVRRFCAQHGAATTREQDLLRSTIILQKPH